MSAKPELRIAAVILAAGGSTRFGTPKQLLAHHGENLVQRIARVATKAGLDPVIVVLGAFASSIELFLSGFDRLTVVTNEDWQTGQASSLRAGINKALSLDSDAALILLADQPLIDETSIKRIVDAFDFEHRVVASNYSGVLGAPALFAREFFPGLLELNGDHGAGAWLRENRDAVTAVNMDEAALDIDTPDDLKHLPRD